MATTAPNPPSAEIKTGWIGRFARKTATLVLIGLALGFAFDLAAPRLYGPERAPTFPLGLVHGALMPVALPSLLMGKDVPIFAVNSIGRVYKIGYIAGINLCGLLFFGFIFRTPRNRVSSSPRSIVGENPVRR